MAQNEDQDDEISAIRSIFDDSTLEIFDGPCPGGRFIIDAEAPNDGHFSLLVSSDNEQGETTVTVDHLSPLYLSFTLLPTYPSKSSPQYQFHALWLTPTISSRLSELVENAWTECEGNPVLFNWYQAAKENIYDLIPQPLLLKECDAPLNQLVSALTDYDRLKKLRQFEASYFACSVCCQDYLGADCELVTPCGHIFCRSCCRSYLSLQVKEGALDRLKCLADECQSPIGGHQLRSILGPELYDRFEQLSLTRGLDSMNDIVQCPRPDCGAPVLTDGPDSKMACCALCHLPFCVYCKKVFHGIAPCTFALGDKKRIVGEYKAASGDARARMEKRYGKQTLLRLVDESMSEEWIKENSKSCPHCRMAIEKNDGCNKMSCSKCGSYFCWLCLRVLNDVDPYKHFNDPKAPCFNKLFAGMTIEDDPWFMR